MEFVFPKKRNATIIFSLLILPLSLQCELTFLPYKACARKARALFGYFSLGSFKAFYWIGEKETRIGSPGSQGGSEIKQISAVLYTIDGAGGWDWRVVPRFHCKSVFKPKELRLEVRIRKPAGIVLIGDQVYLASELVLTRALLCWRYPVTPALTACPRCPEEDTQPRLLFSTHTRAGTTTDRTCPCGLLTWKWVSTPDLKAWLNFTKILCVYILEWLET